MRKTLPSSLSIHSAIEARAVGVKRISTRRDAVSWADVVDGATAARAKQSAAALEVRCCISDKPSQVRS
ncbi:MAG: hypothetical protein SangKO_020150 [Sandaracinaceae bacterium]